MIGKMKEPQEIWQGSITLIHPVEVVEDVMWTQSKWSSGQGFGEVWLPDLTRRPTVGRRWKHHLENKSMKQLEELK